MTRKEEAYFETELADYVLGNDETSDKEFFERIVCANNVIARCLSRFKNDYDELDMKDTITKEETPVSPYYVVSVGNSVSCASLGFYSTEKKAKMKIIEWENKLNPSSVYNNWEEFTYACAHNKTKITNYDISIKYLDAD